MNVLRSILEVLEVLLGFCGVEDLLPEANQFSSSVISWSEGLFFSVMKCWNMLGEHAFKLFTIAKKQQS